MDRRGSDIPAINRWAWSNFHHIIEKRCGDITKQFPLSQQLWTLHDIYHSKYCTNLALITLVPVLNSPERTMSKLSPINNDD